MQAPLAHAWIAAPEPLGALLLVARAEEGLTSIGWRGSAPPPASVEVCADTSPVLGLAARQVTEYLAGTREAFDIPLAPARTPFQRRVRAAVAGIPFGVTVAYGELAESLGGPNLARAIGAANGANPLPIVVPCHRVVGRDGSLTGFSGGLEAKRWLLTHESRCSRASHGAPEGALLFPPEG